MRWRGLSLTAAIVLGTIPGCGWAQIVSDGGFDTQAATVGSYCYNAACPTGPWTLSGGAGFIHQGNIDWPAPTPVSPTAVAFLQGSPSMIRQSVSVATSGSYVVSYWLGSRPAIGGVGGNQTVTVSLAGQIIGQNTLTSGAPFARYISSPVTLSTGTSYTLQFSGSASGDNTAFLDSVSIVSATSTTAYQYDALGRLTNVSHIGGANAGATSTYSLDAAGNRTSVSATAPN